MFRFIQRIVLVMAERIRRFCAGRFQTRSVSRNGACQEKINVLVVGHSKSGKSAFANTLADTQLFAESVFSSPASKQHQENETTMNLNGRAIAVKFVEIVGFDCKKMFREEANLRDLSRILSQTHFHQLVFTSRDRMTDDQLRCIDFLSNVLFPFTDSHLSTYVTMVRTHTQDFDFADDHECELAKQDLVRNFPELMENVSDVIHVNLAPRRGSCEAVSRNESRNLLMRTIEEAQNRIALPLANEVAIYNRMVSYLEVQTCSHDELLRKVELLEAELSFSTEAVASCGTLVYVPEDCQRLRTGHNRQQQACSQHSMEETRGRIFHTKATPAVRGNHGNKPESPVTEAGHAGENRMQPALPHWLDVLKFL